MLFPFVCHQEQCSLCSVPGYGQSCEVRSWLIPCHTAEHPQVSQKGIRARGDNANAKIFVVNIWMIKAVAFWTIKKYQNKITAKRNKKPQAIFPPCLQVQQLFCICKVKLTSFETDYTVFFFLW